MEPVSCDTYTNNTCQLCGLTPLPWRHNGRDSVSNVIMLLVPPFRLTVGGNLCQYYYEALDNIQKISCGPLTKFYDDHHFWSPVNSLHKGQWRGVLMFYLICIWINGWESNREAGDLRRYRAHYDVIVMDIHANAPDWPCPSTVGQRKKLTAVNKQLSKHSRRRSFETP